MMKLYSYYLPTIFFILFLGAQVPIANASCNDCFIILVEKQFTVSGQGLIIRGTVLQGSVKKGAAFKSLGIGREWRGKVREVKIGNNTVSEAGRGKKVGLSVVGIGQIRTKECDVLMEIPDTSAEKADAPLFFQKDINNQSGFLIKGKGRIISGRLIRGTAKVGDEVHLVGGFTDITHWPKRTGKSVITGILKDGRSLQSVSVGDGKLVGLQIRGMDGDSVRNLFFVVGTDFGY